MLSEVKLTDIGLLGQKAKEEQAKLLALLQWHESLVVEGGAKLADVAVRTIQIPEVHRELAARLLQAEAHEVTAKSISTIKRSFSLEQVETAITSALLEIQQYKGPERSDDTKKGYKTLGSFFKQLGLTLEPSFADLSRGHRARDIYDITIDGKQYSYLPSHRSSDYGSLIDIAMKEPSVETMEQSLLRVLTTQYNKRAPVNKKKSQEDIKELLAEKDVDISKAFTAKLQDLKEEIIYYRFKDLHSKLLDNMSADEKKAIENAPTDEKQYEEIFQAVLARNKKLIQESASRFVYLLAL